MEADLATLPNLITVARLLLLPAIVWLTYAQGAGALVAAGLLFTGSALSDWVDGYIARRLDAVTPLGTVLDPVVDKVVVLSVLIVMAERGLFPMWIVLLNLFREFAVTVARQSVAVPNAPVGANWMGKAKFVLQVGLVEVGYSQLALEAVGRSLPGGRRLLFWCALAVTAVSFGFLLNFLRWHRAALFAYLRRRTSDAGQG